MRWEILLLVALVLLVCPISMMWMRRHSRGSHHGGGMTEHGPSAGVRSGGSGADLSGPAPERDPWSAQKSAGLDADRGGPSNSSDKVNRPPRAG